jgi:hypothetical protein
VITQPESSRCTGFAIATGGLALLLVQVLPALADHTPTHTAPTSEPEMIANALAAAPDSVVSDASVVTIDTKGTFRRLHEGSGPFTCVPDDPATPANDPICLDRDGLAWFTAWITRVPPPVGRIGVGYRMQGASTPSNIDPFAVRPPDGTDWRQERPQVLIFNLPAPSGDRLPAGPQVDMSKPWLRWAGSPYAHLVVPLY